MVILREYVFPFLILLVFLVALTAVSARTFLPNDMAAPAPIEDVDSVTQSYTDVSLLKVNFGV